MGCHNIKPNAKIKEYTSYCTSLLFQQPVAWKHCLMANHMMILLDLTRTSSTTGPKMKDPLLWWLSALGSLVVVVKLSIIVGSSGLIVGGLNTPGPKMTVQKLDRNITNPLQRAGGVNERLHHQSGGFPGLLEPYQVHWYRSGALQRDQGQRMGHTY